MDGRPELSYVQMLRNRDAKVGGEKPSIIRLAIIELADRFDALEKSLKQ